MDMELNTCPDTIYEGEVTSKKIFNMFFNGKNKIIYVLSEDNSLLGIITLGKFLEKLETGSDDFINKKFSAVTNNDESVILDYADDLFRKNHITTAIPIVDNENRLCGEVCWKNHRKEKNNKEIDVYKDKIARYIKSKYLSVEVDALRRIFSSQKIVVFGCEEEIVQYFGELFVCRDNLIFVDKIENPYKFMFDNQYLYLDMKTEEYRNRKEIYEKLNNGYDKKTFIGELFFMIENQYCSMFYQCLDNPYCSMIDFIRRYTTGEFFISSKMFIYSEMIEYLKKNKCCITQKIGLYRKEKLKMTYKVNGVNVNNVSGIIAFIGVINHIIQTEILCKKIKKAKMINLCLEGNIVFTEKEKERMKKGFVLHDLVTQNLYEDLQDLYGCNYDFNELSKELGQLANKRCFENDVVLFQDVKSLRLNVEGGIRKTEYQQDEYYGTIYFWGACTTIGVFVEDRFTIPSLIQKKLNQENRKYRVINLGSFINNAEIINKIDIQNNDIIVNLCPALSYELKNNTNVKDISDKFNDLRLNKYCKMECFFDATTHCGNNGNLIYADIIYDELLKVMENTDRVPLKKNNIYSIFKKNDTDLNVLYDFDSYREKLRKEKKIRAGKMGSVVMNCNPFTLGHQYLIEYVSKQVDYLFVFIVEEDLSYFSFKDRYNMAKSGTKHIKNISIVGGGQNGFIHCNISSVFYERRGA